MPRRFFPPCASKALVLSLFFSGACTKSEKVEQSGAPAPEVQQAAIRSAGEPTQDQEPPRSLPTDAPLDRHALHGGHDRKGEGIRELRAGLTTLLVVGETESHPYREILAELALLGGDDAAALALEFQDHPRMVFAEKEVAFAEFYRSLLASGTLQEQRSHVEQALKKLEAPR